MKISIIVPIYKVEKYVGQCIRSILQQTYKDIELILVNDCTPDDSLTIAQQCIKEHQGRLPEIRIISFPENRGLAAARKAGMVAATGDYVISFDSDDFVAPDIVEQLAKEAEETDADIVICDFMYHFPDGSERHVAVRPPQAPSDCMIAVLNGRMHASFCNKLIRRSLYIDHDLYPTEGINMREDFSVMYRAFYFARSVSYVPRPLYFYRRNHANSLSKERSPKIRQQTHRLITLMKAFQTTYPLDDRQQAAFRVFYASNLAATLLYGTLDEVQKYHADYADLRFSDVRRNPVLPFYYKIAAMFYFSHCRLLIPLFSKLFLVLKHAFHK